jgi:hypothetical protein
MDYDKPKSIPAYIHISQRDPFDIFNEFFDFMNDFNHLINQFPLFGNNMSSGIIKNGRFRRTIHIIDVIPVRSNMVNVTQYHKPVNPPKWIIKQGPNHRMGILNDCELTKAIKNAY